MLHIEQKYLKQTWQEKLTQAEHFFDRFLGILRPIPKHFSRFLLGQGGGVVRGWGTKTRFHLCSTEKYIKYN